MNVYYVCIIQYSSFFTNYESQITILASKVCQFPESLPQIPIVSSLSLAIILAALSILFCPLRS